MPTTPTREGAAGEAGTTQTKIVVPGSQAMVSLLGSRDELLRIVEEALASDIHVRGNEITISGDPADNALAVRLFEELLELVADRSDAHHRLGHARARHAPGRRVRAAGGRAEPQHPVPPRPHDPAEDAEPEAVRRRDRPAHDRLRHRPGRHRQDLPRGRQGGAGAAVQAGQPDHPHPAGGRGGGAARLPAGHALRQDRPVPAAAAATRCTTWSTRSRSRGSPRPARSRSPRWRTCAAARSTTRSSSWTRRRTRRPSR